MDETEWLASIDLERMLQFALGNMSERKRRLFGCACCRLTWDLLTDDRSCNAIKTVERYVDRQASYTDFLDAGEQATEAEDVLGLTCIPQLVQNQIPDAHLAAEWAARYSVSLVTRRWFEPWAVAKGIAEALARAAQEAFQTDELSAEAYRSALMRECPLLRDIVGNPFRPVTLDPAWLRWNDGCVPKVAQSIYEERRFGELPILADALEDAGCANADILAHCRGPGPHVRGCWAVDAILGKE